MWLFLAFVFVPMIEIALFIEVGGAIGLWPTLAIVVLTAMLGTVLVRTQGALAIGRLRTSFSTLEDPSRPLADAAMILIAGVLLLTPGFFTDAIGFALLMPPVRRAVFDFVRRRVRVESFEMGGPGARHDPRQRRADIIEAEYEDLDRAEDFGHPPSDRPSGWTRH